MIRSRISARRGFSLLELSVVLGIISLIAGVGMTMATGALKAADRVTTQERLNTIKLALDSHLKTYGYLPCPADRTLNTSDINFGAEARDATVAHVRTTAYTDTGATCNQTTDDATVTNGIVLSGFNTMIGAVPVRTLGLPDSYEGDAWGNKFTYAVPINLASNPTRAAVQRGSIVVKTGTVGSATTITTQRSTLPTSIPPIGPETYGTGSADGGGRLVVTFNAASNVSGALAAAAPGGYIINVKSTSHNGSTTVYTTTPMTATQVVLNMPWVANDTDIQLSWQEPGQSAAYVVVSHGPDGRGAYPLSGTSPIGIPALKLCNTGAAGSNTSPPPCTDSTMNTCIDIKNCDDDATFFDSLYNDGTTQATYFDDYIVWGSNGGYYTTLNTTQYSTCPTGVCESWCAACTTNFPGATASPPVSTMTPSNTVLCKKVVTTNASSCGAYCFWSVTNASGFQKCP